MAYPKRFSTQGKQARYEWARRNHYVLCKEQSSRGSAYRRGYDYPDSGWHETLGSYPVWAAGQDNRRAIDALPSPEWSK